MECELYNIKHGKGTQDHYLCNTILNLYQLREESGSKGYSMITDNVDILRIPMKEYNKFTAQVGEPAKSINMILDNKMNV